MHVILQAISMRKKLLTVALLAMIANGMPAQAASPSTPKSPAHTMSVPVLVNNEGKTVGRFVGGGFFGAALIAYKNKPLVIRLEANPELSKGGMRWESGFLYYASSNCTGKAYLYTVAPSGSHKPVQVMKEGNRFIAYIGRSGDQERPASLQSGRNGGTGICYPSNYTGRVVSPVEATYNLNLLGTPPFYVE